jgi:hypothetical protein
MVISCNCCSFTIQLSFTLLVRVRASCARQLAVPLAVILQEEVIDLEQVSVQGLVDAPVAGSEDQEFTLEELTEAAASTHYNSLAVADIEAAFLEGEQRAHHMRYSSSPPQKRTAQPWGCHLSRGD